MQQNVEIQLIDAIKEFEILINSEHKELFMDILCDYVKYKSIEESKAVKAKSAFNLLIPRMI